MIELKDENGAVLSVAKNPFGDEWVWGFDIDEAEKLIEAIQKDGAQIVLDQIKQDFHFTFVRKDGMLCLRAHIMGVDDPTLKAEIFFGELVSMLYEYGGEKALDAAITRMQSAKTSVKNAT